MTASTSTTSIADLNAMLSMNSYDPEDDTDPALSMDSSSSLMEQFTPEAIQLRLANTLAEKNDALGDFISGMHAESFSPGGLTLTYKSTNLSPTELDLIENKDARQTIDNAFASLGLQGCVILAPAGENASGGQKKYHRGSYIENQRIAATEIVTHVNKMLNTTLVDSRILDKDEKEAGK